MSRVPDLDPAGLTVEQRRMHDAIAGPRGGVVRGPFAIWLRQVGIADAANRFGNQLRLEGKLDRRLFELVTLVVARHWSAQYEWFAHEAAALEHGVPPEVVDALRNRAPIPFGQDDERLVHAIVTQLLTQHRIADETYARALEHFGLDLLIELVTCIGFYVLVAIMLTAFEAPVPGGARPLPD